MAHRLSTDENGVYSTDRGIRTIRNMRPCLVWITNPALKFLKMIEADYGRPGRSAMGQGTNSYTNVQLSDMFPLWLTGEMFMS